MSWLGKIFGGGEKLQPISINDENFKSEILESNVPVLLDVWGPSCAPCQKLAPIIVDIATDYGDRLKVAEMNAAASPRTMGRLGIRGTPTVVYFDRGREVDRVVVFKVSLYHRDIIDNDILAEVT